LNYLQNIKKSGNFPLKLERVLSIDKKKGDINLRTAKNILQHELIGMEVEITDCPLHDKCNTRGMIVDETRNMLVLEQGHKDVEIPKRGTKIIMKLPADETQPDNLIDLEINGNQLIARPEDRVKKNERKTRRK
jgi:ribonuclease P protein subunit POP4